MNAEQKVHTLEILAKYRNNQKFTAIDIWREYLSIMNENIDRHEFSDYLSILHTKKLLKVEGIDLNGMTIYKWNIGE